MAGGAYRQTADTAGYSAFIIHHLSLIKMASGKGKKGFSAGLHDLFSDNAAAQSTLFGVEERRAPAAPQKASAKNFLSDLDAFLQEALEESLEKYDANQPDSVTPSAKTKTTSAPPRKIASGLDALIRQTIDVQEINADEAAGKKRLTVAVDRSKLDQLRVIARLENSYLKDLITQVIDGYIEEYKKDKGVQL